MFQIFTTSAPSHQQASDDKLEPVILLNQNIALTGLKHNMPLIVMSRTAAEQTVQLLNLLNTQVKCVGFYTYRRVSCIQLPWSDTHTKQGC
jgi:hypothetical protein